MVLTLRSEASIGSGIYLGNIRVASFGPVALLVIRDAFQTSPRCGRRWSGWTFDRMRGARK